MGFEELDLREMISFFLPCMDRFAGIYARRGNRWLWGWLFFNDFRNCFEGTSSGVGRGLLRGEGGMFLLVGCCAVLGITAEFPWGERKKGRKGKGMGMEVVDAMLLDHLLCFGRMHFSEVLNLS